MINKDNRLEFEAWARDDFYSDLACVGETWDAQRGMYVDPGHHMAFRAWKASAARRAQVVPVPRFNHTAKRKMEWLTSEGATVTGYAFQKKDGRRGFIDCHGFVGWWQDAAAPQPPAAQAAPVELPEPDGLIRSKLAHLCSFYSTTIRKGDAIYSAETVRALLAAQKDQP